LGTSASQAARGSRPGAVIVGLGDFNGQLSARQISETVRAAVLRLLLLLRDSRALGVDAPVRLYSLLLGCNSVAQISIADSVAAVTCGVLEANRQLAQAQAMTAEPGAPVSSLTFIDLYRDVATSAAHAVSELPQAIESQLRALEARLEPARSLSIGQGARDRLSAEQGWGYWSRLIITDADAPEVNCPPECYDVEPRSPLPPGVLGHDPAFHLGPSYDPARARALLEAVALEEIGWERDAEEAQRVKWFARRASMPMADGRGDVPPAAQVGATPAITTPERGIAGSRRHAISRSCCGIS